MKIKSNGREYDTVRLVARGDYCDIYQGAMDNKESRPVMIKVARDSADNDLLDNEARTLNHLFPVTSPEDGHLRFLPRFLARGEEDGKRANVMPWYGEHVSMAQVIAAYPDGIDWRDMVWMFKRTLDAIGFAHRGSKAVIHGAVIPSHVLIHPVDHGIKLVDWGYAVQLPVEANTSAPEERERRTVWDRIMGEDEPADFHVKAISAAYRDFYPPEILTKQRPGPGTDIFMAAKCAQALVGKTDVPAPIQGFLAALQDPDAANRDLDAWDVYENFAAVVESVVGKPKYRKFLMPGDRP